MFIRISSGSIQEFFPVIKPLTQSWTSQTGKNVSFNVIVPSLPGFLFSSSPPENSTDADTARLFDTLMTDVLGYPKYALHGTDWVCTSFRVFFLSSQLVSDGYAQGCDVGYRLYESFNATVRAAHFAFLPFQPPTPQEIADQNITLSDIGKVTLQRSVDWVTTDQGYFQEQALKVRRQRSVVSGLKLTENTCMQPNDIGLALYDNPVGQLAWLGGDIARWSDPRAGTGPSKLTHTAILTSVSLYYLTETFLSSVWQYTRNANVFRTNYTKPATDAPMFFTLLEYNIAFWPREYAEKVGNLVSYKGALWFSGRCSTLIDSIWIEFGV